MLFFGIYKFVFIIEEEIELFVKKLIVKNVCKILYELIFVFEYREN